MLQSIITRIVVFCTRYPWQVVAMSTLLCLGSAFYTVKYFSISTDISQLISSDLPWRQRELKFHETFPGRNQTILIVVQAPTAELVSQASSALGQALQRRPDLFHTINQTSGSDFFRKNGLLFLATEEVERVSGRLVEATPLINVLVHDRSIRGLTQALSFSLLGIQGGRISLDDAAFAFSSITDAIDNVSVNRQAAFSWTALMSGRPVEVNDLRRFIAVWPVLNFTALEPGRAATDAIRQTVADLNLASQFGASVRLTGPVPIADEEFATVKEGALINNLATIVIVLVILWLALHSARIILAVFITLFVGLCMASAIGLMIVGAFNLISIAFAVLFIGLGVDFGIQFSVRYRAERHKIDDLRTALTQAAARVGAPLTLAAAATAAGFLSFLPTPYRGLSELGQIAGVGMIIAFVTSVTLLPALLTIFKAPGESEQLGYKAMAPLDRFLETHRIAIISLTGLVAIGGLPLLFYLRFDFNPINLRNPNVESVATFLDLRSNPEMGANSVHVLAPSMDEARKIADRMSGLSSVSRVRTLASFVPEDQPRKLAAINRLNTSLGRVFNSTPNVRPPTEEQNRSSLRSAAARLIQTAGTKTGKGADAAKNLSASLNKLADLGPAKWQQVEAVFVGSLDVVIRDLKVLLGARPITLQSLPKEMVDEWITSDKRALVDILPSGDPNDNENLRAFARSVLEVAPEATGGPISILQSGDTIVSAFIHAGFWALISIAILLWITLRRLSDVLLTLLPLLLAGAVTLEICVLIGMQLNFANIIALPLLLGVGVAFKIYYIMAWRAGQRNLLQSSLTRAVMFSAMTTATAFGSLWLSSHPGTSSMGKLMALSLVCTMAAAVLFQPALMGRPRKVQS
jgi:hypothetical protein